MQYYLKTVWFSNFMVQPEWFISIQQLCFSLWSNIHLILESEKIWSEVKTSCENKGILVMLLWKLMETTAPLCKSSGLHFPSHDIDVWKLVEENHQITVERITQIWNISVESVINILTKWYQVIILSIVVIYLWIFLYTTDGSTNTQPSWTQYISLYVLSWFSLPSSLWDFFFLMLLISMLLSLLLTVITIMVVTITENQLYRTINWLLGE